MHNHLEIEFKTFITEQEYLNLLKEFDLENKTFDQTNYYFDTNDNELLNNKIVLRIRKKDKYKLTKKEKAENANYETSEFLKDDEAVQMIQNGFDASRIGINKFVSNICSLKTIRAKAPYKDGTIFFDKSIYMGVIDYEIEYEANDYETGKETFLEFLQSHNIQLNTPISKSKRAFNEYYKVKEKGR